MNQNTRTHEAPFLYEELFYSKTDKKGIIQSGNSVFQRVSEYSWEELIGKPHNTIRHPDMPRAVFHLLWEYLKADRPIGAFVKNRSKNGKYYWVFALALPVEDGYISVRMKPGGALLSIIEKEYAALRSIELSQKLSPKDSQDLLLKRLSELGFPSYSNFMTVALANQIENCSKERGETQPVGIEIMSQLRSLSAEVIAHTNTIIQAYKDSKFLPLNLEVQAARLGEQGQQLSVVANQYQKMVTEINKEIANFDVMSKQVMERIEMGMFYIGASQLLNEVAEYLAKDNNQQDTAAGGIQDINRLSRSYMASSKEGVLEINQVITRFISICTALQTLGSGLELVRMTGKIESARLSNDAEVGSLLNELKKFQQALAGGLKEILERNAKISQCSNQLLRQISDNQQSPSA